MKKKVQMKKMAGVFLALAILGIGLFPPGNVYAAANQAPDADPVVVVLAVSYTHLRAHET